MSLTRLVWLAVRAAAPEGLCPLLPSSSPRTVFLITPTEARLWPLAINKGHPSTPAALTHLNCPHLTLNT